MTIKDFVEQYNNLDDSLKDDFLKENIKFKAYIPYLMKVTLAEKLVEITSIDKKTRNISINSPSSYLLFCRIIIEQYTDLKIEEKTFYNEYDLLNESGILDKILQIIPEKEIDELKMIIDMTQKDLITNKYEYHAFISDQVTRFGELTSVVLKPFMSRITEKIENMDDKSIDKLGKVLEKFLKGIK